MNLIEIVVDGSRLANWTSLSLTRSKGDMTGSLNFNIFLMQGHSGDLISKLLAPFTNVAMGKDIKVYIKNRLQFTGKIDTRNDDGQAETYEISVAARGKTKTLIDSSHQHKTGSIVKPTNRQAIDELIEGFDIGLDWKAETLDLERVEFREGAFVSHELQRIGNEHSHFMYETRDGKLRITDDTGRENGEPFILGQNILSFNCEQSEADAKSEIEVRGHLIAKDKRGLEAIKETAVKVTDKSVQSKSPLILHFQGDGTKKSLERKANFEANKRYATTKNVSITIMGVGSGDLDIGMLHHVEIPTCNVNGVFECTEINIEANSESVTTKLTLAPPPKSISGASGGLAGLLAIAAQNGAGTIEYDGSFPMPWDGPIMSIANAFEQDEPKAANVDLLKIAGQVVQHILPGSIT